MTGGPPSTMSHGQFVALLLGFAGMVIGQFMAILDIQIVAASLADIQAGVGASADEIAWVQTSYLLAEVVIMPLTAYMCRLWSTQRTFLVCCIAFIATSVLTGFSTSFEMMIFTRALQGLAAGAMIPAVFAVAFSAFPRERQVTASVIIGLIVTLAPTVGPTLGGHITEALGWRWLFFINVPPGLLALFLVARWGDFDKGDPSLSKGVDWLGLGLMSVGLISIQYVLEEGAENSWFADDTVLWLTVLGVTTFSGFVWRQLTYRQPIINLKPFADRNFTLGVIMTLVSGIALFGGTFILPLFLAQIRGFSAGQVGTVMLISGITMFVTGPIAGRLVRMTDPRISVFFGFSLAAYGMWLGHGVTAEWGFWEFAALQSIRGFGVMFGMIASQVLTVATLQPSMMKDASAIVNLMRNVGGAVGLAMLSTVLGVQTRLHLTELSASLDPSSSRAVAMIEGMTARYAAQGVADPEGAAAKVMSMILHRQAALLAFGDAFFSLAATAAVAALLAFVAKPSPSMGQSQGSQ
jgi:MFS transporter, DHA2 family, multidrug resistance protein